ncbi:response regulator [Acidovorax sp. LjRoot66]
MSELLEFSGYVVRQATSGKEALDHMFEHFVPVVLIDEDLPDFTGIDLSYHLKAAAQVTWGGKKCVTIAIRGDLAADQVGDWPGADHVVLKPINYDVFNALIARCCNEAAGAAEVRTDLEEMVGKE